MSRVSVVIPVVDEEDQLADCLQTLFAQQPAPAEILVVDGGSTDDSRERIRAPARLVPGPRGRGAQCNVGAREASGDVLWFVHADTRLPPGALAAVRACLEDEDVVAGAFHKRFRSRAWLLRGARLRTAAWHRLGATFGDQTLFVRTSEFRRLGGFRTDLRGEDCELARRLRQRGRIVLLPMEVSTSARRLERDGILRTWAGWWWIWLTELLGRSSPRLGSGAGDRA